MKSHRLWALPPPRQLRLETVTQLLIIQAFGRVRRAAPEGEPAAGGGNVLRVCHSGGELSGGHYRCPKPDEVLCCRPSCVGELMPSADCRHGVDHERLRGCPAHAAGELLTTEVFSQWPLCQAFHNGHQPTLVRVGNVTLHQVSPSTAQSPAPYGIEQTGLAGSGTVDTVRPMKSCSSVRSRAYPGGTAFKEAACVTAAPRLTACPSAARALKGPGLHSS